MREQACQLPAHLVPDDEVREAALDSSAPAGCQESQEVVPCIHAGIGGSTSDGACQGVACAVGVLKLSWACTTYKGKSALTAALT